MKISSNDNRLSAGKLLNIVRKVSASDCDGQGSIKN